MSETAEKKRGGFGLWNMCPDEAEVAWGARLIVEQSYAYREYLRRGRGRRPKQYNASMVHDRQTMHGEAMAKAVFQEQLNKGGQRGSAIVKAIKEAERLFNHYEWDMMRSGPQVLFRDERLEIVGDPRASGGYVYIIAYPVQGA